MKPYAGYSINFEAFWKYYKGAARSDYSRYRAIFVKCFCESEAKYGLSEGYGSDHVNAVGKRLAPICSQTRVLMLSKGVPDAAIKHIITHFKKWFNSYYA
ncbi:MAG: hypothetical protein ACI4AB_08575 [Acetatifactor sp.]